MLSIDMIMPAAGIGKRMGSSVPKQYLKIFDQTVLEYADFTSEEFLEEVASVYQIAHDNGYVYGDSQTTPPCEDGIISCDRLIARALWNLGMNDQPDKGMNVGKEPWYLTTHGFEIVTDQSQLQSGDIVLQDNGISGIPNWQWHTFVLVSYDPETTMCEKYDCGHFTPEGEDRISSEQPFTCPLADYGSQRSISPTARQTSTNNLPSSPLTSPRISRQ